MTKIISCALVLTALLSGTALANMGHKSKKMDTNRDGVISQPEKDAYIQRKKEAADFNRDGVVTGDEWAIFKVSQHKNQYEAVSESRGKNANRHQYKDVAQFYDKDSRGNKWNNMSPAAGGNADDRDYNAIDRNN